jgi:uncharacterized membrane protein YebE (DUF533 family)
MSFLKTLTTLAVGFAAAKGYDKFRKAGGMEGMQDMLKGAGQGPLADQLGQMAEKMGIPGGAQGVKDMLARAGGATGDAMKAGEEGLAGLIAAMQGTAKAGTEMFEKIMGQMTGGAGQAASEETARLMIRAMLMGAKADGSIDEEEKAKITAMLKDASPEEIAFVQAELDAPIDIAALARDAGEALKLQVYTAAATAMKADSPAETAFLDQLAAALGLDAAARAKVHGVVV